MHVPHHRWPTDDRSRLLPRPYVGEFFAQKGGMCRVLAEWNVAGTYVPEERANRSKGIRGAEDGQSGSGASSRDSGRRGGVRARKEREGSEGDDGRKEGNAATVVGGRWRGWSGRETNLLCSGWNLPRLASHTTGM